MTDIKCLSDLLSESSITTLTSKAQAHVRVWFRGQPTFGRPLMPGIYRSNVRVANEEERLQTECRLTQQFRVQSSGLRAGRDSEAEIYFLQQHYKMPTRLLDWTTNPLAALYFAVSKDADKDGEVFAMDTFQLTEKQRPPGGKGIGTQRNKHFREALEVIFHWKDVKDFPDYIMPITPDYMDARINFQRSCFTFHVPKQPVLTSMENKSLNTFVIPRQFKKRMLDELFLLGVDEFSIYGDLESLSRRLKDAYKID
jgi:FRG domain